MSDVTYVNTGNGLIPIITTSNKSWYHPGQMDCFAKISIDQLDRDYTFTDIFTISINSYDCYLVGSNNKFFNITYKDINSIINNNVIDKGKVKLTVKFVKKGEKFFVQSC